MIPPVHFESVSKSYGKLAALRDLSFEIVAGEVVGLFGHNGAGKTTTMKLILGLISPEQGQVRLFGENPCTGQSGALRQRLGYLPENVSFYPQLTGREVLHYFARLKGVAVRRADALLEQVGLAFAVNRRVKTYSKGMRQRLGLAQALLGEPQLLLLDEPTVGLDPVGTHEFYNSLDQLRQQGCGVILCSHVLPGVEQHIQRALILGQGQLLAMGSLEQLRQQANLPVQMQARGAWNVETLQNSLAHLPIRWQQLDHQACRLSVTPQAKLEVMQHLLTLPELQDLETQAPSLESLYLHFTRPLLTTETVRP